jgi:hypothetical protein
MKETAAILRWVLIAPTYFVGLLMGGMLLSAKFDDWGLGRNWCVSFFQIVLLTTLVFLICAVIAPFAKKLTVVLAGLVLSAIIIGSGVINALFALFLEENSALLDFQDYFSITMAVFLGMAWQLLSFSGYTHGKIKACRGFARSSLFWPLEDGGYPTGRNIIH